MTVFYPDVSEFQHGESLRGCVAACARASEGDWLADPQYAGYHRQASSFDIPFMAYHFLESLSSPVAQAHFCFSIVGKNVPLMLDFESFAGGILKKPNETAGSSFNVKFSGLKKRFQGTLGGSYPSVSTAVAFVDSYRALGGTCYVLYMPWWYWTQLGSPSLQPFISRNMVLVSSNYTGYSDNGPGWNPYGSMTPTIWQYTSTGPGTYPTDWNAFKGSGGNRSSTIKELESVWRTGKVSPSPSPPPPSRSRVLFMNGDEMFYLPIGDGAQVAVDIPLAVPQASGIFKPPVQLILNAHGISTVDLLWSNSKGLWQSEHLDWNRDPTLVAIPTDATAVKIRRAQGKTDPIQVTCSWR